MVDFLMRKPAVVLKYIVILAARCRGDLLQSRENLCQGLIGNVCERPAVMLRYYESVSPAQWLDIKKGEHFVGFEELERRDFASRRSQHARSDKD